jgi:hypothetical protein
MVSLERKEVVTVRMKDLASLKHGMTEQEVENALKARGNHQFTALRSSAVIRCIAYCRSDKWEVYYLVFTNQRLTSICEPPPFETREVPYGDSSMIVPVLGDPEVQIDKVLSASDLIGPSLFAALDIEDPQVAPKSSTDPGLTAAYLLTQKLFSNKNKDAERARKYRSLLEKYDPFKASIGSTMQDAEVRLGKPQIVEKISPKREMRYYGSIEYGKTANRELMWLSLVYDDGKVVRVFSDRFVDYDKIRLLEKE